MFIDFNTAMQQANKASFDPLPPGGPYDVAVESAEPTQASTGKPMIKVKYRVETGPHAGRPIWNNFVWSSDSDVALAIFFRHMSFHGLDSAFFATNPAWEQVAERLVGRRVRLELGLRKWQGADRNEVTNVLPPTDAAPVATTQPQPQQPVQQVLPQQPVQVQPQVAQPQEVLTGVVQPPAVQVQQPVQPQTAVQQPVQAVQTPVAAPQVQFDQATQPAQPTTPQAPQPQVQVEQPAPVVNSETEQAPPAVPDVPF